MTLPSDHAEELRLFRTGLHPCGYWPQRQARNLVLDPAAPRLARLYPTALAWGFRRSGDMVYRPDCPGCRDCVPVRIPVEEFRPDRSQRRCLARNADLVTRVAPACCSDAHLALYRRYLQARHPGGGMDDPDANDFERFLIGSLAQVRFLEIRLPAATGPGRLVAVAVTDLAPEALSAVYTFYEPGMAERSLGTFAILQQLAWTRRSARAHLYLGYWIAGHPKMDYKRRFRPLQAFDGHDWQPTRPAHPGDAHHSLVSCPRG